MDKMYFYVRCCGIEGIKSQFSVRCCGIEGIKSQFSTLPTNFLLQQKIPANKHPSCREERQMVQLCAPKHGKIKSFCTRTVTLFHSSQLKIIPQIELSIAHPRGVVTLVGKIYGNTVVAEHLLKNLRWTRDFVAWFQEAQQEKIEFKSSRPDIPWSSSADRRITRITS